MRQVVTQIGLQRAVLLGSAGTSWQHIIGGSAQDTGLWSTGNGWAAYGMVRVLHTLQKWSGSSSMTSQATQLQGYIQGIIQGAMASSESGGLLFNYLGDTSTFGEISGTAMLTAAAYRMAVNNPSMFGSSVIAWADANRKALASHQGSGGIFSPAVNPYDWTSDTPFTTGSPEGQAFTVFLYSAYRDCVGAGVCSPPPSTATTLSVAGIGPIDILTTLVAPVTFSAMPAPTTPTCGSPQSCDANGCAGAFSGLVVNPVCTAGNLIGCPCTPTPNTCGPHQSCDNNGCKGAFSGLTEFPQCTGNFVGCNCTATSNTCGAMKACTDNGCAGAFTGLTEFPQCQGNFAGCNCTVTPSVCGEMQPCDQNGCAGAFTASEVFPQCQGNFVGCNCTVVPPSTNDPGTCGAALPCTMNGCAGAFSGDVPYASCTGNFLGCRCEAIAGSSTCGAMQSCDLHDCAGQWNTTNGKAYCSRNFVGCQCIPQADTCGELQACNANNCNGAFSGDTPYAQCTDFWAGCNCSAVPTTCGAEKPCTDNGCDGIWDPATLTATCAQNFLGCNCLPDASITSLPQAPAPPPPPPPPPASTLPPLVDPWFCAGILAEMDCNGEHTPFGPPCTSQYTTAVVNMDSNEYFVGEIGWFSSPLGPNELCGFITELGGGILGDEINCNDITQQCSGYGVAHYGDISCRTVCPALGDTAFCYQSDPGLGNTPTDTTVSVLLICDRA